MEMTRRTLDEAEKILRQAGALSWIGLRDPELLGCDPEEHEEWLTTASEHELRTWALDVARDEPCDD